MKKTFVILSAALLFAACNSNKSGKGANDTATVTTTTTTTETTTSTTASKDTMGKALLLKSDCLTCHKLDTKLIGPAYYDVAKKYTASPAVIDTLANKIIKGGKGNWGQIPMSPHPAISMDDARQIVKYILSLKK